MLSRKRWSIAHNIGQFVAYSNFLFFLNPKHRGEKFVWSDLYKICDSFSKTSVFISGGDFGKDQKAMEEVAMESARHTLDFCFKESGVKTWIIL